MSFAMLGANDWVDIVVIAVMIYVVIRLLFEARSLSVAIGILALAVLYWLSGIFNLPLTHLILNSFFGFFIIFIAIIFQKELRRLFSFVGFFSFRRGAPPNEATINTVSRAVAKLSAEKIGALIVFPGRESISRHFEEGISLEGDISQELLLSIFSEETPGHDGAIIIEDNKVRRFGVHLPLAEHADGGGRFGGLRHRAALGLSEHSDAFTIVVSGETGSIDVALNGEWEHCEDEHELKKKLEDFLKYIMPAGGSTHPIQWIERNAVIFAFSFMLAATAWFIFSPKFALSEQSFTAPLEFQNVPAGYVVEDTTPREVVLTLQGASTDFDSLSPQSLDTVVDLSGAPVGTLGAGGWVTIPVTVKDVNKPSNFSVVRVEPASVQVEIVKQ